MALILDVPSLKLGEGGREGQVSLSRWREVSGSQKIWSLSRHWSEQHSTWNRVCVFIIIPTCSLHLNACSASPGDCILNPDQASVLRVLSRIT